MTAPDPRTDVGTNAVVAGDPVQWILPVQVNGSGASVDLTTLGTTWVADLRQGVGMTPEIAFTVDASGAATGQLILNLTGAQTLSMLSGQGPTHWFFNVQVTGGGVSPQTLMKGHLVVYGSYI